jgi:threonyl-tRNA synthetase
MEYIDENNTRQRPIMIHRAILGSIERFFGVLIENYAGAFPLWMAPVQARIMPITDDMMPFCQVSGVCHIPLPIWGDFLPPAT